MLLLLITLLIESCLDPSFWPEALHFFVYTWNRMCLKLLNKSPFKLYGGRKPSIRHLRPFGTASYVSVHRQRRLKLNAKARRGYLMSYAFRTRGYRIWLPDTNQIIESSNVTFDESRCGPVRNGAAVGTEDYALFSSRWWIKSRKHG